MAPGFKHFDDPLVPSPNIELHENHYYTTAQGHKVYANFGYPKQATSESYGIFIAWHGGGLLSGGRKCEFVFPCIKGQALPLSN